jgi:hypothetical protein
MTPGGFEKLVEEGLNTPRSSEEYVARLMGAIDSAGLAVSLTVLPKMILLIQN